MIARHLFVGAIALGLLLPGASALAAPAAVLRATYAAAPPTQVQTASAFVVPVTLTNTGTDPWLTTSPQPINLSYHWIDLGGTTVVWDGAKVIEQKDKTFSNAGKVGLWTKADSVTYFDDLTVMPVAQL